MKSLIILLELMVLSTIWSLSSASAQELGDDAQIEPVPPPPSNPTSRVEGDAHERPETPQSGPGASVGRVSADALGAVLGVAAPALLGLGLALVLEPGCSGDFCAAPFVGLGVATIGAAFTMPLGVLIAGSVAGGSGGYGWTLLGSLAGAAAGTLLVGLGVLSGDVAILTVAGTLGGLLYLAGGIVGYELSSDDNRQEAIEAIAMPWLSPTADGEGVSVGWFSTH